jgi:hypothetical protein
MLWALGTAGGGERGEWRGLRNPKYKAAYFRAAKKYIEQKKA